MKREETYYDPAALYERLTVGVLRDARPIVFLFGSAITAPQKPGDPGVLGTSDIIDLIRAEFDMPDKQRAFDQRSDS